MRSVRQVLSVAVLTVLVVGGYVYYQEVVLAREEPAAATQQRRERTAIVEVAPAEAHELGIVLEAVGTTRAQRSVDIVPHAEGRIVEADIAAGREVTAGTVLARLDDDIERASLAEAEATLDERSAALDRAETLLRSSNMSQATADQIRSEVAKAKAAVDRARRHLSDREVRAPFDGVLGITSIDVGARVDTDTVLTSLDDLAAVEIEFSLPETVYGQIAEGQPVSAETAAFPGRIFKGEVVAVDSRIDQTSRAFKVRARLPNEARTLPAGMFMRLSLSLGEREVVAVTDEAILVEGGGAFIFVVEDGKAVRRRVTTGLRRGGMVEITEGVKAGEKVIARGIQSLRDGIKVNIIGEKGAGPAGQQPPANGGSGDGRPAGEATPTADAPTGRRPS